MLLRCFLLGGLFCRGLKTLNKDEFIEISSHLVRLGV